MEVSYEIGRRVKRLRKRRGITQEELSQMSNIERGTISSYETGLTQPNCQKLAELSKCLGCSADYLLFEIDEIGFDSRLLECMSGIGELESIEREVILSMVEGYLDQRRIFQRSKYKTPNYKKLVFEQK